MTRLTFTLVTLVSHCVGLAGAADPPPRFVVNDRTQPRFVVRSAFAPACVCGDACACPAGACPAGCPVAAPAGTVRTNEGRLIRMTPTGWVFADQGAASQAFYAAPAAFAPQQLGGCAGGQCGIPQTRGGIFRR